MTIYYSATANAFYDTDINLAMPVDARPIADARHAELMESQALGKVIKADNDNHPIAVSPVVTLARMAINARAKRDSLLAGSDWVTLRALESSEPIPADWQAYRQALRDVPAQSGFPQSITWPTKPAEISL